MYPRVVFPSFDSESQLNDSMKRPLLVALLALVVVTAHGQSIVAEYNFTLGNASVDTDPTSVASPISDVGLGSTLNTSFGNPAPSLQAVGSNINSAASPPTNATTDFYTFTLTPVVGVSLDFTTLRIDVATLTSEPTGTANSYFIGLQTSLNSFATNVDTVYTVTNNTTFQNLSFNLGAFAATSGTTAIQFRIVIRDDNNASSRGLALDNVVLSANVIPEPSTYAMMGLGAALLVGIQRFRRKSS